MTLVYFELSKNNFRLNYNLRRFMNTDPDRLINDVFAKTG